MKLAGSVWRMARRLRGLLFLISLLVFGASAYIYIGLTALTETSKTAQQARQVAASELTRGQHRLTGLKAEESSLLSAISRLTSIARDEANGVAGPGLSGIAGMGPNARRDYRAVDELRRRVGPLQHAVARIRASISTLTLSVRAAGAETRTAKAAATSDRQVALLLAVLAALLLLPALRGPRTIRPATAGPRPSQVIRYPYVTDGRHGWAHLLTIRMISSAVSALADTADRDRYAEEWAADLAEIHGRWRRLRWSLLLRAFGPRGINAARCSPRPRRY